MKQQFYSFILLPIFFHTLIFTESFSLVSCNILGEHAYQAWAKVTTMKHGDRKKIMQAAFAKNGPLHKDIICLQECSLNDSGYSSQKKKALPTDEYQEIKQLLNNEYEFIDPITRNNTQPHKTKAGKQVTTLQGKSSVLPFATTSIAYKKNRFKAVNPYVFQIKDQEGKTKYITTVTLKDLQAAPDALPVKIISCHLPYRAQLQGESEALKNIETQLLSHSGTENYTIICGDFNYNTYQAHSNEPQDPDKKSYNRLMQTMKNGLCAKFNLPKNCKYHYSDAAQLAGIGQVGQIITSVDSHGWNHIDFMFYTQDAPPKTKSQKKLICKSYTQLPQDPTKLIKHHKLDQTIYGPIFDDSDNGYFSDHVAMIAEFEIAEPSAAPKQKIHAQLNQLALSLEQLGKS